MILHPSRNDEYQGTAAWVRASGAEAHGAKDGGPGGAAMSPSSPSSSKTSTSSRSPFAPTLGGSSLERVTLHSSRNDDEYQGTAAWAWASGAEARGAKDGGPGGGGHEPHGGLAARHGIVGEALRKRPAVDDGAVEHPDLCGRRSQAQVVLWWCRGI